MQLIRSFVSVCSFDTNNIYTYHMDPFLSFQSLAKRLREIQEEKRKDKKKMYSFFWEEFFLVLGLSLILLFIKFIPFITRFFPFSLLFQGNLRHHKHKQIREYIDFMENRKEAKELGLKVISIDKSSQTDIFLYFTKNQEDAQVAQLFVKSATASFISTNPDNIYVNSIEKNLIKAVIPNNLFGKK